MLAHSFGFSQEISLLGGEAGLAEAIDAAQDTAMHIIQERTHRIPLRSPPPFAQPVLVSHFWQV